LAVIWQKYDFLSQNPEITTLFSDYVQNCVMGDIFLNHNTPLKSYELLTRTPDFFKPARCRV
jgi:conjugal transfer mating pair stabilization protein TraG